MMQFYINYYYKMCKCGHENQFHEGIGEECIGRCHICNECELFREVKHVKC